MILKALRFFAGWLICAVALLLPYRARTAYGLFLARLAHLPFVLFGRLARHMLRSLGEQRGEAGLP